jgi:hypothetical protein
MVFEEFKATISRAININNEVFDAPAKSANEP